MSDGYKPNPVLEAIDDESDDHYREMFKIMAHGVPFKEVRWMAKWIVWHTEIDWVALSEEIGLPEPTYQTLVIEIEKYAVKLQKKLGTGNFRAPTK